MPGTDGHRSVELANGWQRYIYELVDDFEAIDLYAVYAALDDTISGAFEENFYNQIDDQSSVWKPRKDSLPHPLLIKTGKMFAAATNPSHPGHRFEVQGEGAGYGINGGVVHYAIFHHLGTVKMPSRRQIFLTPQQEQRVTDKLADVVDEALGL